MTTRVRGLLDLSKVELETIARAVRQEIVASPLTTAGLAQLSQLAVDGRASSLVGIDGRGVLAVIDAVLAERRRPEELLVDLVWTGPDVAGSTACDTAVVVRELFARAQHTLDRE